VLPSSSVPKEEISMKQAASRAAFLLGLFLDSEDTCSSETSVDFQRTTRRYIPEDRIVYNQRSENLKSYIVSSAEVTPLLN
jgi:hypothetical protein